MGIDMDINVNVLFVIAVIVMVYNVIQGYRKGMVKAVISLVSMVVLCVVMALLANAVSSYHDGKYYNLAVMVILLAVLGIAHHLLGVVFFSAKMIVKLPVISFLDKLLGIVFGVCETVLILWTVYTFTMMMDMGVIGEMLLAYTEDNRILSWLYRHNYLAYGIQHLLAEFSFVPLEQLL